MYNLPNVLGMNHRSLRSRRNFRDPASNCSVSTCFIPWSDGFLSRVMLQENFGEEYVSENMWQLPSGKEYSQVFHAIYLELQTANIVDSGLLFGSLDVLRYRCGSDEWA